MRKQLLSEDAMIYFTPAAILEYIKPGSIIEGAIPENNFLITAYDAITSNPAYGKRSA